MIQPIFMWIGTSFISFTLSFKE